MLAYVLTDFYSDHNDMSLHVIAMSLLRYLVEIGDPLEDMVEIGRFIMARIC